MNSLLCQMKVVFPSRTGILFTEVSFTTKVSFSAQLRGASVHQQLTLCDETSLGRE